MRNSFGRHLVRDMLIVFASILFAYLLSKSDAIHLLLQSGQTSPLLSSIIAGALFTSIFTVAPSAIGLIEISESLPPVLVAFCGAIGAMSIDLFITAFIRKDISQDLADLNKFAVRKHIIKAFHFGFLKWFAFIGGMFVIMTPLPDEFGLFLIGLSKVKGWMLPLVFFSAHFVGIYLIIEIASKL